MNRGLRALGWLMLAIGLAVGVPAVVVGTAYSAGYAAGQGYRDALGSCPSAPFDEDDQAVQASLQHGTRHPL